MVCFDYFCFSAMLGRYVDGRSRKVWVKFMIPEKFPKPLTGVSLDID